MFYQVVTTTGKYPPESIELRSFATTEEIDTTNKFSPINKPHIRPNAVYVAAIGTHWSNTAWQKVVDMVHYTNTHGICCWLTEFPDQCVTMPYDAIDILKDSACRSALDAGFEWVLLIDNDILPEPDMLVKLLDWGVPVIVPLVIDYNLKVTLSAPVYNPNSGLRRIRWAVFSCLLMKTKVFNCFPNGVLFTNSMTEPAVYDRLAHFGHGVYIDTNTELKLAKNPCYIGDHNTLDDRWEFLKTVDKARKQKPDRRPIDIRDNREFYLPIELATGELASTAPKQEEIKPVETNPVVNTGEEIIKPDEK